MHALRLVALWTVALSLSGLAAADHTGCEREITSADPATTNRIDLPDGTVIYVEERGVPEPFNTVPPVPGSGFLIGQGTWTYQESNGLDGLQRGGVPAIPPCMGLCVGADPINDETCGAGPDKLLF